MTGETAAETRPWAERFLEQLRAKGTVAAAAKAANVGRSTVYDEMQRNPAFKGQVDAVMSECVELVEATLFQCALDAEGPTRWRDRLTYLRARRPDLYADKLRADQEAAIKAETRAEVLGQLQQEIMGLAPEARDLILSALGKTVKVLEP
jgi:hypothetical protein